MSIQKSFLQTRGTRSIDCSASHGLGMITGSIARSATRRYLIYSEADFEVFRPAGGTRCTDWDEIWHGGGYRNFTPIGATVRV